jgi:hypothetical protein
VTKKRLQPDQGGSLAKLERLGKGLFAVPKAEMDAKRAAYESEKAGRRKGKPA